MAPLSNRSKQKAAISSEEDTGAEDYQQKILVVDDDEIHARLMQFFLIAEGYDVMYVPSGHEALSYVEHYRPDLVLLDIMMPGISGYETAQIIKQRKETSGIAIIMITALNDPEARLRGLECGAQDFLTKPVDRTELTVRVRNLLHLKNYSDFLRHHERLLERELEAKTHEVRLQCIETVLTLTRAAEYRDETTGNHVNRVSHYTSTLAEQLGMDSLFCDHIFYASPMHDIGKLAIPDHILLKPGGLTPNEWEIMKTHTTLGREMLRGNHSQYLEMGAQIALSHHECWDGTGYPKGLRGTDVALPARIMAICDVYDALRSKRPYKKNHSHDTAVDIIRKGDGRTRPGQFDPVILNAFLACNHQFAQIYMEFNPRTTAH